MRAIQCHSGWNNLALSLLDNVTIPYAWSEYISSRWFFAWSAFYFPIRIDCRRKGYERKTSGILHSRESYVWTSEKVNRTTWQNQERYSTKPSGKCTNMQHLGSICKVHKIKDEHSVKPDPMLLSFMTLYRISWKSGKYQNSRDAASKGLPITTSTTTNYSEGRHIHFTSHRSETNSIAERAGRRIKEGTSAALWRSGLDEKWRALSVLPNRDPWQAMSPTIPSMLAGYDYALAVQKSKYWFDWQLWRGHCYYPCIIRSGWKNQPGTAGFTAIHTQERQVQSHPGFIALTERMLCQAHHTFEPLQGALRRCTHTRESQAEICVFYRTLIPREWGSLLGIEKSAFFLWIASISCRPRRAGILSKLSEAEHHTSLLLEVQKNLLLSQARSEMNIQQWKGRRRRQGSSWFKLTDSFSTHGTLPDESVIWSFPKKKRLALHRIRGKRKSPSRNSYENFPGNGRIEKVLLYRSWKSSTVENRWTFSTRNGKSIYSELAYGPNSGNARQSEWFQGFLWSWDGNHLWVIPRSQSALEYSVSLWNALLRFLPAAWQTELEWYIGKRFEDLLRTSWTDSSFIWKGKKSYRYLLRTCVSEHRKICSESWWNRQKHSNLCNSHTEMCQNVFNLEFSLSCRRSLSAKLFGGTTEESGLGSAFR